MDLSISYHLLKAVHVIAFVSWMAGLLYLPRLFVYHCQAIKGGELDQTLKIMERKLLRYIMNPAMIVTLISGISLVSVVGHEGLGGWFHVKAVFLLLLFASHGFLAKYRKSFERGENKKSQKFFRIVNEIPTISMIFIVVMAVLKPF